MLSNRSTGKTAEEKLLQLPEIVALGYTRLTENLASAVSIAQIRAIDYGRSVT